jgi:DtxR family Mn-dependent transcriptional regulator
MIGDAEIPRRGDHRPALSESQEDYLKQILLLQGRRGKVGTKELANRLGVRPASVTEMVGRLAQLELVEHRPYKGVTLTSSGRRVAMEMVRHHRLLETYLVQELGYSWDEVHEEAERLEHVISERFEARIAEAMGHPTHDPHGDPIPDAELTMPVDGNRVRLDALAAGERGELVRVGVQDRQNLGVLEDSDLSLGQTLEVVGSETDSIRIRVSGTEIDLPADLARRLWIERNEP